LTPTTVRSAGGLGPHGKSPDAFADVARDRENRVVILPGTGDEWSGVRATAGTRSLSQGLIANGYDRVHWEGRALYTRLMFTEYLKKCMQDLLGYGLAMEGLALMEQIEPL
jgi:hypothetical protein